MNREELLKYGNELTICGFIVGNANESKIIVLPGESMSLKQQYISPNDEEIHQIIRQMDVQEIEGLQKVVLRKSQRNIDQRVSWQVFRRDDFKCVYCGADDVPMTVDHIVLWEHMGDSVPDNLNCSCKKCNKTRGSMDYLDWLQSEYLKTTFKDAVMSYKLEPDTPSILFERWKEAEKLPLRKTKRSR